MNASATIFKEITTTPAPRLRMGTMILIVGVIVGLIADLIWPVGPERSVTINAARVALSGLVLGAAYWPLVAAAVASVRVNDRLRSLAGLPHSRKGSFLYLWGPVLVLVPSLILIATSHTREGSSPWGVFIFSFVVYVVLYVAGEFHSAKAKRVVTNMIIEDDNGALVEPLRLIKEQVRPDIPKTAPEAITRFLNIDVLAARRERRR